MSACSRRNATNFLAAVCAAGGHYGLALADLTTGDFLATELENESRPVDRIAASATRRGHLSERSTPVYTTLSVAEVGPSPKPVASPPPAIPRRPMVGS